MQNLQSCCGSILSTPCIQFLFRGGDKSWVSKHQQPSTILLFLLTLTSLVSLHFDDHVAICWLQCGSAGGRADEVDGSGSGGLVRGAVGFVLGAGGQVCRPSAAQTEVTLLELTKNGWWDAEVVLAPSAGKSLKLSLEVKSWPQNCSFCFKPTKV